LYEEAIEELKDMIHSDTSVSKKDKIEMSLQLMRLCRSAGHLDLAKRAFEKALGLDETLYRDYILFIAETHAEEELARLHNRVLCVDEQLATFASCLMKSRPQIPFKPSIIQE
jgi:glycine cleavage system protein P-like pyridoxal-binding family